MRRRPCRRSIQTQRQLRRLLKDTRMPEAYWRLYERAEGEPIISECVAILARARTISSVQDEPDGWIMLDAMVQTMLDVGEGRLKLTDNEDY